MKGSSFILGFSAIVLQGGLWSWLWNNLVPGALAALALSFLGWLALRLKRGARNLLKARSRYRITGIWIGACKLPRHPPDVEAVEIYRLVTKKEYVTLTFFHYLPKVSEVRKYEGAGIYRGIVLSAFYYIPEAQSSESGVFVLRKAGEKFKGVYAQYDLAAEMKLYRSEEDFVLRRVQISLWSQVKIMLGLPPFPCYQQARNLYDAALREQPDRTTNSERGGQADPGEICGCLLL